MNTINMNTITSNMATISVTLSFEFLSRSVPADRVERMNRGTIAHEEAETDRERNSKLSVTLIVAILLVIVFMFIVFI